MEPVSPRINARGIEGSGSSRTGWRRAYGAWLPLRWHTLSDGVKYVELRLMNEFASEFTWTHSPDETQNVAAAFTRRLSAGSMVALYGEIGAGKTCFVQGLIHALGITRDVRSPTYTLMNEYAGQFRIAHFDLYRLTSPDEILQLGWEDYTDDPELITIVEWADRAESLIPTDAWRITIAHGEQENDRKVVFARGVPP